MTRLELIIGVKDVAKSSQWYQQLLNCKSKHGGDAFEILADEDDTVVLCLHKWGEHNHSTLTAPAAAPGNGMILFFRVDNLLDVWENARGLNAAIEEEPHMNQNSGREEFSLR